MTDATRRYAKQFSVGDYVVRRPGTLGNMDGRSPAGLIEEISECGPHILFTVKSQNRRETFAADTYVKARS
jgi:hypothetical protein